MPKQKSSEANMPKQKSSEASMSKRKMSVRNETKQKVKDSGNKVLPKSKRVRKKQPAKQTTIQSGLKKTGYAKGEIDD